MKKFLSLTLSLVMVLSAISVSMISASAEEKTLNLSNISETQLAGGSCKYYPSITNVKGTETDDFILQLKLSSASSGTGKGFYISVPQATWDNITTNYEVKKIVLKIRTDAALTARVYMADSSLVSTQTQNPSTSVAEQSKSVTLGTTATSVSFNITETALANNRRVFYFYHSSSSSMTSVYVESATVYYESNSAPTTDAVATEEAASIRLNTPNGIRFYTTVDETKLAELVGENTYEIGTLIAPADALGEDGELTEADECLEIAYEAREDDGSIKYFTDSTDFSGIVGSITNIRETEKDSDGDTNGNIDRDFVGRAYVKIINGEESTYYYSATTSTRSLARVAYDYKNSDNYVANENVEKWAAEYVPAE